MTGLQDRLAEQSTHPDTVRLREPDKITAELRKRMERLPAGHPSSPYSADGSRKPPVPDLTRSEYPLPGDPDYRAYGRERELDQDLSTAHKPTIGPDGSWEWKGRVLTPEQSLLADAASQRCREAEGRDADGNYAEHGLTPAMRRIEAQLEHGRLAPETENFALKSPDRFKEKLADRISLQPGESMTTLAARIHDGIRYTFVYDDEHYTSGTQRTETALEQSGYDLITRRPSWHGPDYKGSNTKWHDPDSGLLFEVQFHTDASWEAKQATHPSYERLADPTTPPDERDRLESYQREITARVPVPPGALEIPHYSKEASELWPTI